MKIILLFLFFNIQAIYSQSDLLINEFVASNINSIRDENLNHSDWIELFNGSNSVIDIAGMYMSDDPDDPYKSIIPGGSNLTIIQPDSFLILWADSNPETGVLHLNFQLSSAGEQIILTANNGLTIIDSVSFPNKQQIILMEDLLPTRLFLNIFQDQPPAWPMDPVIWV